MLDVQMYISESDLNIKKLAAQTLTLITEMKEVKDLLSPDQLAIIIEPLIKNYIASRKTKSVLAPKTSVVVDDDSDDSTKEVKLIFY